MTSMLAIEKLREQGNEHYRSKNYVDAIIYYDKIMELETDVDRSKTLGNRSAAYLALKKWREAEKDARRALELEFGNEKYLFRLASSLLEQAADEKKAEECLKVCDDAILLHPDSAALKNLKLRVKRQLKQGEHSALQASAEGKNGDDKMKKSSRKDRQGFFKSLSSNTASIFGADGDNALYCEPSDGVSDSKGLENPFATDGAIIIETIPGASYTDIEYNMLTHVKDIVKSIQRGGLSSAGLLKNHFLTGKFKNLCDKEYFQRTLFPGFSKEAAESMPQDMRELLLWKQLTLDLTKVARSAAKVLVSVKMKGQKGGDIMDKETEKTLTPQIAQEALAVELEAAVRQLSKQVSKVMAKVQLSVASPTEEQAQWDQLDDDIWPDILQGAHKLCVQEEYLGDAWSALILKDIVRFASREPMDDVPLPGREADATVDISKVGEVEVNLPTVPVRMAWLQSRYEAYPALSEAISKLEGLPYELNLKQEGAMGLKEPAKGCLSLLHLPAFSEQPERLDNRLGSTDSGIRLSCYYCLIPTDHQDKSSDDAGADTGSPQICLDHRLRPDLDGGEDATNAPRAQSKPEQVSLESDSLVLLQSTEVLHQRKCAQFEYYVIALYVHGTDDAP